MNKLNKEVCKRCVHECATSEGSCDFLSWRETDELLWNESKQICCWAKVKWEMFSIYEIPDCCRYKLEHIVLNEKPE